MEYVLDAAHWTGQTAAGYAGNPLGELTSAALPALGGTLLFTRGWSRERRITPLKVVGVALANTTLFASLKLYSTYRAYETASYWGGHAATVYNWASILQPFLNGIPYGVLVNGAWYTVMWALQPLVTPVAEQFAKKTIQTMLLEIGKASLLLGAVATCDALALSEFLLTQPEVSNRHRITTLLFATVWTGATIWWRSNLLPGLGR